jgi:hypothetical protein
MADTGVRIETPAGPVIVHGALSREQIAWGQRYLLQVYMEREAERDSEAACFVQGAADTQQ